MTPRFIDLYYEWMEKGQLPFHGLCNSIPDDMMEIFKLFSPTIEDYELLRKEMLVSLSYSNELDIQEGYWASDIEVGLPNPEKRQFSFGETRQHIILFCAAINDEL